MSKISRGETSALLREFLAIFRYLDRRARNLDVALPPGQILRIGGGPFGTFLKSICVFLFFLAILFFADA